MPSSPGFRNMKLISLLIVMVYFTGIGAQKYEDEQFFLPHYQPGSSVFASDSSLYLPPETHTAIPYYAMKNNNKLPFQYLPPTGTKAPASFPTPFPVVLSSSLVPIFDEDDEPKTRNERPISSPQPPPQLKRFNSTQRSNIKEPEKREMRPIPRTVNYEHPIDRIDVKPAHFPMNLGPTSNPPVNQTPASRRTIPILTVDSMGIRSDHGVDMMKAGSFPTHQYIHAPGVFISSSTTEPAIPIIRLSNEMDLDGSFSYEALGADQTHYVQHSRMENMGSDKEEQVVEGSYSYVGDNGQTYTVHYIADSNGFRATGDHLPVAPPMPEIIQRAVQYNLAEEAKRPPHLKSWQEDEKNYELEAEKIQRYPSSPPRNLFTGRTPEAFSYSFSPSIAQNNQNNQNNQINQNSQNNLATAASSLQSLKTSVDYTKDQPQVKLNNSPISPQITFLASQGAHVPSMNAPQQTIARIFTTEKSNMPQLMNYEAVIKDADQESNKALWRWQYGINSNNANQNTNKNTISRSSGDEIMINFSDMTAEQYTSMIQSQLEPKIRNNVPQMHYADEQVNIYNYNNDKTQEYQKQNTTENNKAKTESEYQNLVPYNDGSQNKVMNQNYVIPNTHSYQNQNAYAYLSNNQQMNYLTNNAYNQYYSNDVSPAPPALATTEQIIESQDNWYKSTDKSNQTPIELAKQVENPALAPTFHQSKLITQHDFIPPSQTVTKSYDYEESFYESRKINDVTKGVKFDVSNSSPSPVYFSASAMQNIDNNFKISTTEQPPTTSSEVSVRFIDFTKTDDIKSRPASSSEASIRFVDFIKPDDSKFRPVTNKNIEEYREQETTTTEPSVEDILENNFFLKNLVRTRKTENNPNNHIEMEPKIKHQTINAEPKVEKVPKYIQHQTQIMNDIKGYRKKTADLSDILNVVAQKNHFESSKVKPKNKPITFSNINQGNRMIYIPAHQEEYNEEEKEKAITNNFRTLNHQQQEELRGIIKNYKVLQRNNNIIRNEEDRLNQLRRDLSPPPLKMLHSPNLPPLGRAGPSMKSYLPPIFV